jgi:glycosyltransferase involved in cell wall biosynthesis
LYVHIPYDTLPELMRERPDLVFSYELGFRSLASALYRCWNRRSRLALCVCVSEHTERGRGGARWLLRRALLRSADAITFNGPSCRRYLESLGVPTHKLFPFSYAADDRVLPSGAPSDTPAPNRSLLVVGQLIERKGIVPVLNSLTAHCQQHPEQTWAVSFIGTGPLEATIRNWRSPANLQLALLGSLPPQELAQNWSRFGVLLFPTLADEWGLVVNEALRAGLPVIGSRYAQASSTLIEPGCNGWVYTPDLSGDLSRCLNDLWHQSAEQLTRMRQASRSSVSHLTCRASADAAASMLRQLYLDTLKSTTTALSR